MFLKSFETQHHGNIFRSSMVAIVTVLEFYAGIGGMHYALNRTFEDSEVGSCHIAAAFDINTTTNVIYAHNFPKSGLKQANIQGLTTGVLDAYHADMWAMSPPCQPYTRVGNKLGLADKRSDSFSHLMDCLKAMQHPPIYFLLENVVGFETSEGRELLLSTLTHLRYQVQEFLLSPVQFGIPNSRPRYFCLAKRATGGEVDINNPSQFQSEPPRSSADDNTTRPMRHVGDYMTDDSKADFVELSIPDHLLAKYCAAMDIVCKDSITSSCFTKAYTQYDKGAGSVVSISHLTLSEIAGLKSSERFERYRSTKSLEEAMDLMRPLGLRYFSWREVANLMGFPNSFEKPENITKKQMYRALGNSVNVVVVSELMKHLLFSM